MRTISIVCLIGFVMLVPARWALADVAANLSQAQELYKARQYTQAEQSYLTVMQQGDRNTGEGGDAAFAACKKLPLVYIATDRLPEARDAVQQLLSRYAGYEFLPHAIHEIVEGSEALLKVAQVRQLYQDMVTTQPGDSQAIWLKMGVAIASVHLAEDKAVDAVVQNITAQHGADDRAAEALNHIAWAYRKLGRYNEALTIYLYVVNNWAQKDRVVFAQQSIAICQIRLGDRQAADEALQVMLQKFGRDSNTSKLLAWSVYEYLQAGETEGAYKVFDLVLQTYPEAPETIDALLSLATAVIQRDDRARIEPTVQTLLTRFAPTEAKASALHVVANMLGWKCRDYGNYPLDEQNPPGICNRSLLAIANYTLATWPRSDWAMWAERDLATAAIHRGDNASAEAAISRLSTDYADRNGTTEALNFLADYCLQLKKDGRAETVYQHLVTEHPTDEVILLAEVGLGVTQLHEGNDAGAEAIFQKVMAEYANHPGLSKLVNLMAEGYRDRAMDIELEQRKRPDKIPYAVRIASEGRPEIVKSYYRRAIETWEIIINQLPASADITPVAYTFAGEAYDCIGDPEKALEYFTIVTEQHPAYQHADYALFMVSRMWQRLQARGVVTESQAWPMIMQASQTLLNRYPRSEYARIARKTVDSMTATEIRRKERANERQQN